MASEKTETDPPIILKSEVEDPAMNAVRYIFLLLHFSGCEGKELSAYFIRKLTIEAVEN